MAAGRMQALKEQVQALILRAAGLMQALMPVVEVKRRPVMVRAAGLMQALMPVVEAKRRLPILRAAGQMVIPAQMLTEKMWLQKCRVQTERM